MALGHGFHPYNPDKFGQTSYPNLMGTTSPNPCLPPSKVNWILRNQSTFPVGEELPQSAIKQSSLGDIATEGSLQAVHGLSVSASERWWLNNRNIILGARSSRSFAPLALFQILFQRTIHPPKIDKKETFLNKMLKNRINTGFKALFIVEP